MKKGVIIRGISCLILLGTVGAITAGKIFVDNKKETVTETSTYQSKEINHALATGDEVVGSWDVSENGDGSVTATLYGDGKMVISGTGNMKNYSNSSDRPYYSNKNDIKTVEIQNGVTSIGSYVFYYCSSLTSIEIQSSVTSIESYAFYYCSSLTSIKIPSSVTKIGQYAFSGCSSLTNIEIPNSVTSIGQWAFQGCIGLTSIEIPSSVTSIESYAFPGCSSLTSINVEKDNKNYISENGILFNKDKTKIICYPAGKRDISYIIPSTITSIESSAFSGCMSLKSIEIPSSVISIGSSTFAECSSLTSIEIPSSVTSIRDWTFFRCSSLTNIEIPEKVTNIGYGAFEYCSSLTNLKIPSSVTSIGNYAFYDCRSLTSIEIPSNVTSIGSTAFEYCRSLTSINVNENNTEYSSDNGILFNKDKTEIKCYPEGKKDIISYIIPKTVTSIGSNAFYGCSGLTSIEIPSSVTKIGLYAFWGCNNLTIYYKRNPILEQLLDFKKNIAINAVDTKIVDKNNNELKDTDIITTGTKIKTTVNNQEVIYTIIVTGDTNGDGQADLKDILSINKHRLNKAQLTDEYLLAGDVNADGKVDLKDLLQINKYRLGKINTL